MASRPLPSWEYDVRTVDIPSPEGLENGGRYRGREWWWISGVGAGVSGWGRGRGHVALLDPVPRPSGSEKISDIVAALRMMSESRMLPLRLVQAIGQYVAAREEDLAKHAPLPRKRRERGSKPSQKDDEPWGA